MAGDNDYPNPDNYPVPSFKSPVPAPDVDPDAGTLLYVGYNPDWQKVLEGALMQLLLPSTWAGTDEEKILALNRAETLRWLLTEPQSVAGGIPTPFWDEAQDVDDEEPADMQTWYGYVADPDEPPGDLTFVENATIWAFTGFLAFASFEVGFAPAIAFHTIAPRFVLAFKRGDVGEVIRVIIDSAEAGQVDTTSASPGDLIEFEVVGDQDLSEHDLLLVQME